MFYKTAFHLLAKHTYSQLALFPLFTVWKMVIFQDYIQNKFNHNYDNKCQRRQLVTSKILFSLHTLLLLLFLFLFVEKKKYPSSSSNSVIRKMKYWIGRYAKNIIQIQIQSCCCCHLKRKPTIKIVY